MTYKDTIRGISLPFIAKGRYTGSGNGYSYQICKKGDDLIETCIWPKKVCFELTPEEEKKFAEFPFTEEGLLEALETIYEVIQER